MYFLRYIILLLFIISFNSAGAYGLKFRGSNYPIDQRTSYSVFDDNSPVYQDFFEVQFDMALYPSVDIGYVLDISGEKADQTFNLFFDLRGDDVLFRLNQEGKSVLIALPVNKEEMTKNHWFTVKITFNLKQNEVRLRVHDSEKICTGVYLTESFKPDIVFGRSGHMIDIPSIAINNVIITGKQIYRFPLNEVEGENVHDSSGKRMGSVKNPEWLVNEAFHWKKEASFYSSSEAGSCYDSERNILYYFNCDSIFSYHVETGEVSAKATKESCPMQLFLVNGFVDTTKEKLYVYEVYHDPEHDKDISIVSLDLKTLEWSVEGTDHLEMQLHHHDSFYDASERTYTLFGGFGNMHYSNDFWTLKLDTAATANLKWEHVQSLLGDRICPRYFSAIGYVPEKQWAYIFGGMGNDSGEQIVGRYYFHDLYKVDLIKKQVQKLWELEGEPDRVPARGMVLRGDSAFYLLRYCESVSHSYLHLYDFSIRDGSYRVLADSIPIISDKITTNAHLYYNERRKRLFVTVQESKDDISSRFTIYSLLCPPVSGSVYAKDEKTGFTFLVITGCILVLSGACGWMVWKKKAKTKIRVTGKNEDEVKVSSPAVVKHYPDLLKCQSNAVYLFGEFTVFDKKGHDISYMFPLRIRQVFFLILYNSASGGISSKDLSDRLWPDKPKDKVKNSRGVALNHVRTLLNELSGIELVYEKGCFRFVISETFYCDFLHCMKLVSGSLEEGLRQEFITIISRGKFAAFLEGPLFDQPKEEMECKLEVVLLEQMRKSFESEDYQAAVSLAKAEFNIDPINEEALSCCIQSYFHMKHENLAIAVFQQFMVEYLKETGKEYARPFSDFWY